MDLMKLVWILFIVVYIGFVTLICSYVTRSWLFFIFVFMNVVALGVLINAKCYEGAAGVVRDLGDHVLKFLLQKYGNDWIRGARNLNSAFNKYGSALFSNEQQQ